MRIIILVLLILPLSSVNAGVYTWVDEDGNTHFSDKPHEGSKELEVEESMSFTPPPTPTGSAGKDDGPKKEATAKYTEITITQPANDAIVRSNEGKVAISIGVQPGIQAGHKIHLFLDSVKLEGASETGSMELQGVNRGSHSLVAAIVDAAGKELMRSPTATFHLRQHSILHPSPNKNAPVTPTNPKNIVPAT